MELHVLPECYVDTCLVETLVPPVDKYNHQHGCTNVENQMVDRKNNKGKYSDQFAVGIIDKDKKSIRYLNECKQVDQCNEDLYLMKHIIKHHYLVQFYPAQEQWIINTCHRLGINLSDYKLPSNVKELCKIAKKTTSKDDARFKELFIEFEKRSDDLAIRKLKNWIKLLVKDNYKVSLDELKQN